MAMCHVLFLLKNATKFFLHSMVASVFNIMYKCKKLRQKEEGSILYYKISKFNL